LRISSFFEERVSGRYPVYFELFDVFTSEPIGRILACFAALKGHMARRQIRGAKKDVKLTKPEGLAASGAEMDAYLSS
jgi:hypothetical protein